MMAKSKKISKSRAGFSLAEMLVVLTVVSVVTAFALPFFARTVRDTRLHEAYAALTHNSNALGQHYRRKATFKANSTTWPELPVAATDHFCIRMQGNPRGTQEETYTLKAVAFDAGREPRVLRMNHDGRVLLCASSSSRCAEDGAFFRGGSSVDKNCVVFAE